MSERSRGPITASPAERALPEGLVALTQARTTATLEAASVQHSRDEGAGALEEGSDALSDPPRPPGCVRAVELELWPDRQPIEGLLRAPDGSERSFRGWLELINLLVLASEGDDQPRG